MAVVEGVRPTAARPPGPTATKAAAVADGLAAPSPTPLVTASPAPNAETDAQADQGRAALHPEADARPTAVPTPQPTPKPTPKPTAKPTPKPTPKPKPMPSSLAARSLAQLRWIGVVLASTYAWTYGDGGRSGANPPGHLDTQAGT